MNPDGRSASDALRGVIGFFKTPGLRDLGQSGPYLHTGKKRELEEVLEFYVSSANRPAPGPPAQRLGGDRRDLPRPTATSIRSRPSCARSTRTTTDAPRRRVALAARLTYEPTLATAERRVEVMGTTLDLVVRMKYRDEALAASEAALAEIRRVETLLTTWKPGGELWRVDEGAPGKPVAVSRELAELLADRLRLDPAHAGRLRPDRPSPHPRLGPARQGPHPDAGRARRRAQGLGRRSLPHRRRREHRDRASRPTPASTRARGARATRSSSPTARCGRPASQARSSISAARSSRSAATRTSGRGASRSPTRAIASRPSPSSASRPLGLDLGQLRARPRRRRAAGSATSSIRGRASPRADFGSVTVVAPSALVADILSTAFFVLGPEKGLALSAALRKEGVENEVLFLVDRGARARGRLEPRHRQPRSLGRPPCGGRPHAPTTLTSGGRSHASRIPCSGCPRPRARRRRDRAGADAPPTPTPAPLSPGGAPAPARAAARRHARRAREDQGVFDRRDDRRAARRALAPDRHPRPGDPEHEDGRGRRRHSRPARSPARSPSSATASARPPRRSTA